MSPTRTSAACLASVMGDHDSNLQILAVRALDAKVNNRTFALHARSVFLDRLRDHTGLTENMLVLLRTEGLLP